jgi:hypothetical protein
VDWEFEPHATLLKEVRKEGVVGRGKTRLRRVQRWEVNLGDSRKIEN